MRYAFEYRLLPQVLKGYKICKNKAAHIWAWHYSVCKWGVEALTVTGDVYAHFFFEPSKSSTMNYDYFNDLLNEELSNFMCTTINRVEAIRSNISIAYPDEIEKINTFLAVRKSQVYQELKAKGETPNYLMFDILKGVWVKPTQKMLMFLNSSKFELQPYPYYLCIFTFGGDDVIAERNNLTTKEDIIKTVKEFDKHFYHSIALSYCVDPTFSSWESCVVVADFEGDFGKEETPIK